MTAWPWMCVRMVLTWMTPESLRAIALADESQPLVGPARGQRVITPNPHTSMHVVHSESKAEVLPSSEVHVLSVDRNIGIGVLLWIED